MPEIRTVYQELNTTNLNNMRDRFRDPELFIGVIVSSTNNQIGGIARGLEHNLGGYEMTVRRDPVTLEDTYRIIGDNGNELIICSDTYYAENPRLSRIANVVIWDDMFADPSPRRREAERVQIEHIPYGRAFAEGRYRRGAITDAYIIDDLAVDDHTGIGEWAIPPNVVDTFNRVNIPPIPQPELDELFAQISRQFSRDIASMAMEVGDEAVEELQESPELDAYLEDFLVIKT